MSAPHCNGSSLAEWLGDLVMLGWVKEYQTLVSGALALLGGLFVVLAAMANIEEARRKDRQERAEKLRSALALAVGAFTRAVHAFHLNEIGELTFTSRTIELISSEIARVSPRMASALIECSIEVDVGLTKLSDEIKGADYWLKDAGFLVQAGASNAVAALFYIIHGVEIDASGNLTEKRLSLKSVRQVLSESGVTDARFKAVRFEYMFHDATPSE